MLGGICYLIFSLFYVPFLVFSIFEITKHEFKITSLTRRIIFIFISICYLSNILEKVVTPEINEKFLYNIVPLGNLSPFLFTLTTIFIFLPEKWCKSFYTIMAIFTIPMLLASFYNAVGFVVSWQPWSYTCVIFDCVGHGVFALFGYYLLRNNIVEFNKKNMIFVTIFAFLIPIIALVTNIIFDTQFFGLNLNGKHNIYNVRITENSYVSAVIYFVGLAAILALSYFLGKFIQSKFKGEKTR